MIDSKLIISHSKEAMGLALFCNTLVCMCLLSVPHIHHGITLFIWVYMTVSTIATHTDLKRYIGKVLKGENL